MPDQNVSTEETTPKYLFKIKYRSTVTDTFVKAMYGRKTPVVPVSTYRIFYLDVDISDLGYVDHRVLYIFLDMHG